MRQKPSDAQHRSALPIAGTRATAASALEPRGAQSREPVSIECALPRLELFLGQLIAAASFLKRDSAIAQRCNDCGFAASHPSLGIWRRQISHQPRLPLG